MPDQSLKFEVDRELFPFESRFLELENGIRVHYVDEGQGPTILMLHGNPSWSFLYRKMILALRNSYRCIALDISRLWLDGGATGTTVLRRGNIAKL